MHVKFSITISVWAYSTSIWSITFIFQPQYLPAFDFAPLFYFYISLSNSLEEAATDLPIVLASDPEDELEGGHLIYEALQEVVQDASEDVYTGG